MLILLAHAAMVGWMARRNSPNANEIAHLPAGIYIWQFGKFDVYPVNPPLVRLVAAVPALLCDPKTDWSRYYSHGAVRSEFLLADDFITANGGENSCHYFFLARAVLIPVSILGAWICFSWARELYGTTSGHLALLLWCFDPNIITWAACINSDLAATVAGIAVVYAHWHWLRNPAWERAFAVGILLGVALLTKLTWIVLLVVLPATWLAWACANARPRWRVSKNSFYQLAVILSTGLFVLNLGYLFRGSFQRLGDYRFVSQSLGGENTSADPWEGGNRFRETFLEYVPLPFPKDYIAGIDLQNRDFEQGKDSYLLGEWSQHGWWYYYIVAAGAKIPLGIWGLFVLAIFGACRRRSPLSLSGGCLGHIWRSTFVLLFPALFLFVLVSAETGFSRHFRYVLPVFPFVFVWISRVGRWLQEGKTTAGAAVILFLAWFLVSSMSVFPHSMSYFNQLAGGPRGGHRILLDSNLDWGQDVLYLKRWTKEHPEVEPLRVDCHGHRALPKALNIGPVASVGANVNVNLAETPARLPSLSPGWHALSTHRLHKTYPHFLKQTPVARIGYSIKVFHIGKEDISSPAK
ncbi:MAG: glycosyltransferase family 39 protein [Planctomycetota bacterium]